MASPVPWRVVIEPYLPSFALVAHGLLAFATDETLLAEAVFQTLHLPSTNLEFFIVHSDAHPESDAGAAFLDMCRWSKRSVA